MTPEGSGRTGLRLPWSRSGRPVPRLVVRPLERFLKLEAGSASLLMVAAVAALVWRNAGGTSYDDFWSTTLTVELESLRFEEDLLHLLGFDARRSLDDGLPELAEWVAAQRVDERGEKAVSELRARGLVG